MAVPGQLPSIGERIVALRLGRSPRMTQRELADRAGVSVSLIKKLEQELRHSAQLTSLHKIARALDVDVGALLPHSSRINITVENGVEHIEVEATGDTGEEEQGVIAIRRAIMTLWEDAEPASVEELEQQARYAWMAFSTNRFDVLGRQLPGFIATARASVQVAPSSRLRAALSDAYAVAASMLTMLGHVDLAYLAMERALSAADRSGDELRHVALSGRMSWLLLHQTGGADQAKRLAVEEAERHEPKLGKATAPQLQVWAGLLVCGAVAAARDSRPDEADDLLNLAEAATTRLLVAGQAGRHAQLPASMQFAVRNEIVLGMPQVIMQQVDVAVVTDRPGRALAIAKRMPPDADLPAMSWARHLADVASAQTRLRRDSEAVETLLEVERRAPYWMRYQPYPRVIVAELLERGRRVRTPQLRGLASRLGVAA